MASNHDSILAEVALLQERLDQEQQKSELLAHQLQTSERLLDHFRQAVDNSPNAIFSIDLEGKIITWNPSCTAIFNYDDSILGSHFRQLVLHAEQISFIEREILRGKEVKTFSNLDLVYRCRNGEAREMVSRIYPVQSESGVVRGFVFANTDVTERNRIHRELDRYRHQLEELVEERTRELKEEIAQRMGAQRALQASYDVLVTILDSMQLAVQVTSLAQDEIIFRNNWLRTLLAEGSATVPDYQLFTPLLDGEPAGKEALRTALAARHRQRSLTYFDPVAGRWFLLYERVITWVDRSLVRLQVATDITERKQVDEERQRLEKLESLGILAGGIAHDFNNLLTGIMGNLSLLKHQTESGTPNLSLLDGAVTAASRATALTQQLLTFSKGGNPVRSVMAVDEVLREAVSFSLRGSAVKATFEIAPDLANVEADAGQLSQVFHNLAINAKQVMLDGGMLSVMAINVMSETLPLLRDLPLGKYIQIDFADTGPGIPSGIIDRIFDPYFTTKTKGEGLGLAMVHTIITKHKGKIVVSPNPVKGVTFRVFLPATDHVAQPEVEERAEIPKSSGRILLMDDEEAIREVGEAILTHLGYSVETVADGEALLSRYAMSMAAENVYDAVILDLTIPGGMGGEEVAAQLCQLNPSVILIASSGYSDSPVLADYTRFGFSAVLKKPYTVGEVSTVLRSLVNR